MKIVSLTKACLGHEFVLAAVGAVYDQLDALVFVNSDHDWSGMPTRNRVRETIEEWQGGGGDSAGKVHHINGSFTNQMHQYAAGYQYILDNFPDVDWIFIFDSDEVWDSFTFSLVRARLEKLMSENAVSCQMHTYIKSPFYRVAPPELCQPCIFLRPIFPEFPGIRGNKGGPRLFMPDVFFHHFTLVRETEMDALSKLRLSFLGDKDDNPDCRPNDLVQWERDVWNKMPHVKDFHPTHSMEGCWHSIKIVGPNDLPAAVHDLPIVKKYLKEGQE